MKKLLTIVILAVIILPSCSDSYEKKVSEKITEAENQIVGQVINYITKR